MLGVEEFSALPVSRLFIIHVGWGPAGAAAALILASVITLLASAIYVVSSGLQNRVWGTPSRTALRVRTRIKTLRGCYGRLVRDSRHLHAS